MRDWSGAFRMGKLYEFNGDLKGYFLGRNNYFDSDGSENMAFIITYPEPIT